ncbi:MAG TPA: N-acyl homoserine lactonase family protein [Longimicrobiaceae bacterium]|nr:N-acyl homoserine lactonase family protein [Longimicrobiaceae bacterium]
MKVYPLHVGDTRVPYGQFYGGSGNDWVGWRAAWRFMTDRSHNIIVPIYAFLIDHPRAGLILIDAGINWDMAHAHRQYYQRWGWRLITDEDEYRLTRPQELAAQVKRLGYSVEDIESVVLTHLHEDHLGGLREVPQARVVLSLDAWNSKNLGVFSWREWSPSFTFATAEVITFSSGPFHSFDSSQDLLGDGSIILLPTPGHADGHLSVLVRMAGYELLITGDVIYTLRHLDFEQVRQIMLGKRMREQQIDSIRRIRRLREVLPGTVVLPSHDHTTYQSRLLEIFLADGELSDQERQEIATYEARLFTENWHLAPAALPHFVEAQDSGNVGSVAEP